MGSHHHGLAHDLDQIRLQSTTLAARRQALRWCAGLGAVGLIGCGSGGGTNSDTATTGTSGSTDTTGTTGTTGSTGTTPPTPPSGTQQPGAGTGAPGPGAGGTGSGTTTEAPGADACPVVAEETNGPYPADGSNTANGSLVNALALTGIVRSDIRTSIAGASGTAAGVPLKVRLQLVNSYASCASLEGFAVYLWHCDRGGDYSLYSTAVINQNYLRGVQASDADGMVEFTTIFPGCYSGRMPHIHFEIYRSLAVATDASHCIKTSQLAFPTDVCNVVYQQAEGYTASIRNFAQISFASDNVFSDGTTTQMSTVTGSLTEGYTATLVVGVPA